MTDNVMDLIGAVGRANKDLANIYYNIADERFVEGDYEGFNYFIRRANALTEESHHLVDDLARIIDFSRA